MRELELLAPARDLQCGIAAVDCGADAVYIGAERFGARASAGNSLEDIAALVKYAHAFRVKVYVALNTLIFDNEAGESNALVGELRRIGADALIVQDMAFTVFAREKAVLLHASTQADNRSIEDVKRMKALGFKRVILARELSLRQIREIHAACPDIELEVFVHGALCTSYSGACYASHYFFNRSANRGCCAQFCRMKFSLADSAGTVIKQNFHALSLKDLALINRLEELADAGVTAFKIEGRLKDAAYVKNVTAAYSRRLDGICRRRKEEYRRSSIGETEYNFSPDINKTFNRGYTSYFLDGRQPRISSPETPKSTGEQAGTVKEIRGNMIVVSSVSTFSNGDGLCFIDRNSELKGFRVNRANGNRLYPFRLPDGLEKGMTLFRNNDAAFEKLLSRSAAVRFIPLKLILSAPPEGFLLRAESAAISPAETRIDFPHEAALKPQTDNIKRQLQRWGDTKYRITEIEISGDAGKYFLPSSVLSALRRGLRDVLDREIPLSVENKAPLPPVDKEEMRDLSKGFKPKNVSNSISKNLYESLGFSAFHAAPEADPSSFSLPLMQCKHCIRYSLGFCVKHGGGKPAWREPLFLTFADGKRVRLSFDCVKCQMNIYPAETPQYPCGNAAITIAKL